MTLFVLRYISCLLIFVLGLKAPGIIGQGSGIYHNIGQSTSPDMVNLLFLFLIYLLI